MKPDNHPQMNKVLKMLEIDIELLEMPPKPFYQLPLETSIKIHGCEKRIEIETNVELLKIGLTSGRAETVSSTVQVTKN